MRHYSRQLDQFIESKPYAYSSFKDTDSRTWVSYYQDAEELIHSSTFNYSIIGSRPVTIDRFEQCLIQHETTKVVFVSE